MRTILATSLLIFTLFGIGFIPIMAQGPTETPTPTATETSTATPTITPTPDLYSLMTIEPSGQAGGVSYIVTAGQAAIFAELSFISIILLIFIFLGLRRRG